MPMASRNRSPSSPASIAKPTVAPNPPALAGRKKRIGAREHKPNVAATSTATTTARIRRAPETPPSRSAQPNNAGSAAAIGCTTRGLVHAVEFLTVHLISVEHRRMRERQPLAGAEHRRLGRAATGGEHLEDLAAPRRCNA